MECTPRIEFYTRSFKMTTDMMERCAGAGSCFEGVETSCGKVNYTTKVTELSDIANNNPGHTYCEESCGCAACGCFFCTPACIFYRNFAIPSSATIHTLFSCPT